MATTKKAAAKKAPAKKAAARKMPAKKPAAFTHAPAARGPKLGEQSVAGFVRDANGLYLPTVLAKPVVVPSNKLREGLEAAQGQIKKTLQGFAAVFTQEFEVSEIALTLSFNADGKFLGFGLGGAMSVSIKIVPSQDDGA